MPTKKTPRRNSRKETEVDSPFPTAADTWRVFVDSAGRVFACSVESGQEIPDAEIGTDRMDAIRKAVCPLVYEGKAAIRIGKSWRGETNPFGPKIDRMDVEAYLIASGECLSIREIGAEYIMPVREAASIEAAHVAFRYLASMHWSGLWELREAIEQGVIAVQGYPLDKLARADILDRGYHGAVAAYLSGKLTCTQDAAGRYYVSIPHLVSWLAAMDVLTFNQLFSPRPELRPTVRYLFMGGCPVCRPFMIYVCTIIIYDGWNLETGECPAQADGYNLEISEHSPRAVVQVRGFGMPEPEPHKPALGDTDKGGAVKTEELPRGEWNIDTAVNTITLRVDGRPVTWNLACKNGKAMGAILGAFRKGLTFKELADVTHPDDLGKLRRGELSPDKLVSRLSALVGDLRKNLAKAGIPKDVLPMPARNPDDFRVYLALDSLKRGNQ